MPIRQLQVSGVRNLQPLTINPHPAINFLYGDNGSGKSSVLEAIALLSAGKSFRTTQFKHVLSHQQDRMELMLQLDDEHLGECELHSLRFKEWRSTAEDQWLSVDLPGGSGALVACSGD